MEKRVLLAIFLSFLVLYFYQALLVKPVPTEVPAQPAAATQGRQPRHQPRRRSRPRPPRPSRRPRPHRQPRHWWASRLERDIVVETAAVRAVFTNRGAELKSWTLKRYFADKPQPQDPATGPLQALVRYIRRQFETKEKQPLDLVPVRVRPGDARPFRLAIDDAAVSRRLSECAVRGDERARRAAR